MEIFALVIDWAEVWIMLIPLVIWYKKPVQPVFMKPVLIYIVAAFILNLICDGMSLFFNNGSRNTLSNTVFYNLHSLTRFICFTVFFFRLQHYSFRRIQWILISLFTIIFLIYFLFVDRFFNEDHISSDLMTGEAFFSLFFCMLYYLSFLREEVEDFRVRKDFWVVTGLSIFMVVNFFVFLFYQPLLIDNVNLAISIWNFHNLAYIIFILFISKALYVLDTNKS